MGWWASSSKLDIYIFVSLKFPALILIPLKIYIFLTLYQNQLSRLNSLNYVHSSRNCITITPWEATICASSKFIISPYHLRFLIPILPLLLERRCRDDNTIISKRTFYSVKKKKKEKKKRQSFVTLWKRNETIIILLKLNYLSAFFKKQY